ncbi:MAG: RNA polymerase sigma factor, partial [Bacteroidota bacterium]
LFYPLQQTAHSLHLIECMSSITKPILSLIRRCLRNDRKAQQALYLRYRVDMFRICMRYAKNSLSAEDMLQEGFINIFKDLKNFDQRGSFEGWLRRVMTNAALQYLRRHNKLAIDSTDLPEDLFGKEAIDYITSKDNADAIMHMLQ